LSLYTYSFNNPINSYDPDGRSTYVDGTGDVKNVIFDNDLSIHQERDSGSACSSRKIGETHFVDSFTNGNGKPMGHVNIGKDITASVIKIASKANGMSLPIVMMESRDKKSLDIKWSTPGVVGPHKAQQGFLFKGKYLTLRDAGNVLYGINTYNKGLSRDTAMKAAGAWAQTKSLGSTFLGGMGKEYGPAPYYGEDPITGSRIDFGYKLAPSLFPSVNNTGE
jgi:filamentous hemagglutinin